MLSVTLLAFFLGLAHAFKVTTSGELTAALEEGEPHLVITAHLDLTSVHENMAWRNGTAAYGIIQSTQLSVQGNCSSAKIPDGVDSKVVLPNQCVIITEIPFVYIRYRKGARQVVPAVDLWLHNLYIWMPRIYDAGLDIMVSALSQSQRIWATRVTLHGDNGDISPLSHDSTIVSALAYNGGRFFWAGGIASDTSRAVVALNGFASVENITLARVYSPNNAPFEATEEGAIRIGPGILRDPGSIDLMGADASKANATARIFAGPPLLDVLLTDELGNTDYEPSLPLADAATVLVTGNAPAFFSLTNPRLAEIQQAAGVTTPITAPPIDTLMTSVASPPVVVPPEPASSKEPPTSPIVQPALAPAPDEGDSSSTALAAGVAGSVAVAAVVVAAVSVALLVRKRRQQIPRDPDKGASNVGSSQALEAHRMLPSTVEYQNGGRYGTSAESASGDESHAMSAQSFNSSAVREPDVRGIVRVRPASTVPKTDPVAAVVRISSAVTSRSPSVPTDILESMRPVPPGNTAFGSITSLNLGTDALATRPGLPPLDEATALEVSLDRAHRAGSQVLGGYIPLGGAERCSGGQGCVQFVYDVETRKDYAVKFFLQREAFVREAELYQQEGLRAMMPATVKICKNEDGELVGPDGFTFPPFIIIDRGESLVEWQRRWEVGCEISTALQTLIHIASRLKQLHEAGWVHMDLKPSNVLWLPQQHAWTLIDFGCTASSGKEAPLAFTPAYAAPEVAAAYEARARTIVVEPSADIWSFGLIAYEMLTDCQVFKPGTSRAAIFDALAGRTKLPWEAGEGGKAPAGLSKLRAFRSSVMQCLSREAAKWPSIKTLLNAWYRVFDAHATTSVTALRTVEPPTLPTLPQALSDS